ncbi:MAG: GNAT family N-acetyltransferase [Clostridia bacterium]|jgi:RimJ/RimL family protein N-acetyltransferase|nr:GNAT family N-acetyltransferase [Clostridia bacterium]
MINIETERMVMSIEYDVINREIRFPENNGNINILDLKPAPGIIFYEKGNSENRICHINLSDSKRRLEISYGIDNKEFEHQKYMKEGVCSFVNWLFSETSEMELHARICNNATSQHILESAGFVKNGKAEDGSTWFTLKKY